jgi:TonB family protein
MSRWFPLAAISILAQAIAVAQQPVSTPSLTFSAGNIANGSYVNDCLGFTYPVSNDWDVSSGFAGALPSVTAKPIGGNGLILVVLNQHAQRPFRNMIVMTAVRAKDETTDAKEFISKFVLQDIKSTGEGEELTRDAFPVSLAGHDFYRANLKFDSPVGIVYKTALAIKFRGYFLGWMLVAASTSELEASVDSLQHLSLQEDQPNPKCVAGAESVPTRSGKLIAAVSDLEPPPTDLGSGTIRVSQSVMQGLLIKKVTAAYPPLARQARIQGTVVLTAVINANGDIENLRVVSGHPMLVPGAIAAVKQWKFKSYFLNGQAMKVETTITVDFSLV